MTKNAKLFTIIVGLLAFLGYGSFFIVEQKEQAIVLQFGEFVPPVRSEPGLYFKLPYFLQDVIKYDKRILEVNLKPKTLPDVNQKQVIIDAFVKYKITDPVKFYRAVQNYPRLSREVDSILMASLKNTLGQIEFQELLSEKRQEVMQNIRGTVINKAEEFGVDIVDLRIRRADLPEANANSIFQRMIAEREKEAREFRSEGQEQSKIIMSKAEKERTIMLAEAKKKAEILRGEGDARATKIFADSYGKDINFFNFYKTMQAYKESLDKDNTSFVLSPDSDFMRFFEKLDR
jgi:membrane protease subunit HflC